MDPNVGQPFVFKKFGCPVCGNRFATLAEKKHHLRSDHPKGGPRA